MEWHVKRLNFVHTTMSAVIFHYVSGGFVSNYFLSPPFCISSGTVDFSLFPFLFPLPALQATGSSFCSCPDHPRNNFSFATFSSCTRTDRYSFVFVSFFSHLSLHEISFVANGRRLFLAVRERDSTGYE